MVAVPAVIPVTTPVEDTEATVVLVLLHTPPAAASLSVVVDPAQTVVTPVMLPAFGTGLTVIGLTATAVPQLLVTE
jgi:hypothetical protein